MTIRLASPFSDHAVLQRDLPIPVWGVAKPDEEVQVRLAGHLAEIKAGPDGTWCVRLPPLPAGGPHELTASSPSGRVVISDVLIGEVWLCSGQSNMEWRLCETDQLGNEKDNALGGLRLLSVRSPARLGRQNSFNETWKVCDHRAIADFSAVGAWFGKDLHRVLGVPVGLICNAWGGTRVQTWISREGLMREPEGIDEVRHYESYVFNRSQLKSGEFLSIADWERRGAPKDTGNAGLAAGWTSTGFDDAAWGTMPVPSRWQDHGHPGSGVFWFRRTVDLPAAWAGRDLTLHLGAIDKHDDTWVNGERVGGLSWEQGPDTWRTPRVYTVPGKAVTAGRLAIAVRARSHAFHGGLIGPSTELRLHPVGDENGTLPLTGIWRYRVEQDWGLQVLPKTPFGPGDQNSPYTLFDSRIAPIAPYGIRGAIWYQGESNAGEPKVYARLLPAMIRDWRRAWGQGDFPFLQVQLANFRLPVDLPVQSGWAELRDAQVATLAEPQTGMAVAIDVGDDNDIHPRDKRSVGQRLARWALAHTYGQAITPSGPLFAGATIEADGRMRCRFHHATGLRTRDGKAPSRVAIAGTERNFRTAETRIEGETLVAWHPEVNRPAAVRYAWADNPAGCNLVNADDLPASPFRSDAW